jgi:hypothetical protein
VQQGSLSASFAEAEWFERKQTLSQDGYGCKMISLLKSAKHFFDTKLYRASNSGSGICLGEKFYRSSNLSNV